MSSKDTTYRPDHSAGVSNTDNDIDLFLSNGSNAAAPQNLLPSSSPSSAGASDQRVLLGTADVQEWEFLQDEQDDEIAAPPLFRRTPRPQELLVADGAESSLDQFVDEILEDDPMIADTNDERMIGSLPNSPPASDLIDLSYPDDNEEDEHDNGFGITESFQGLNPRGDRFLMPMVPDLNESQPVVWNSMRRVAPYSQGEKDVDAMEGLKSPALSRPKAITSEERCLTPQSWQTPQSSMMPVSGRLTLRRKYYSAPASPKSPMSKMSNRSAKSETYYHVYETDPKTPPRPVPPFVVVHNTGHAIVKVTPKSSMFSDRPGALLALLEEESSTTSSVSCRSWLRPTLILVSLGVLVLAAVTVAAGLISSKQAHNSALATLQPSFVLLEDEDIPDDNVLKVPYEETENPDFYYEKGSTALPRTPAPTLEEDVPWNNYVIGLLSTESPGTFAQLDDTSSPQWNALKWVSLEYSKRGTITYNQQSSLQLFCLATLFFATDGANWKDNSGWLNPGTSECDWVGVTCDSTRFVIALDLKDNGLSGSLPPEIMLVNYLQALVLTENTIGGTVPSELSRLSELTELVLAGNDLFGTIPAELRNLDLLTKLDLSLNRFIGTIITEIGSMSNLEQLNLCSNDLTGQVPSELSSLQYLRSLNLASNRLLGDVPDAICDLGSSITRGGPVPEMIVDCSVACQCCSQCCEYDSSSTAQCCSA